VDNIKMDLRNWMRTGFNWHTVGSSSGILWKRWRTFRFHKRRGISWL